jgi:hypothetical protein
MPGARSRDSPPWNGALADTAMLTTLARNAIEHDPQTVPPPPDGAEQSSLPPRPLPSATSHPGKSKSSPSSPRTVQPRDRHSLDGQATKTSRPTSATCSPNSATRPHPSRHRRLRIRPRHPRYSAPLTSRSGTELHDPDERGCVGWCRGQRRCLRGSHLDHSPTPIRGAVPPDGQLTLDTLSALLRGSLATRRSLGCSADPSDQSARRMGSLGADPDIRR